MFRPFQTAEDSHKHSLETLNLLYEYDDFMLSIGSICDMGSGLGHDTEWWASRTTRDENPIPLGIRCTAVDINKKPKFQDTTFEITYVKDNFETFESKQKFDIIWSHDSFQYALDPLTTLKNWNRLLTPGGMVVIIVPQFTNLDYNRVAYDQPSGCYYNYTLVSMMHMLAVNGFDCKSGFFQKKVNDPWIKCIAYKSEHAPMNPRTNTWYTLLDRQLLPDSAENSITKFGYVRQHDLVLPWLDKSLEDFSRH